MTPFQEFASVFRIIVYLGAVYYAFRLTRLFITPTITWLIVTTTLTLTLASIPMSLLGIWLTARIIISMLIALGFFASLAKIYYDTKRKQDTEINDLTHD